MATVHHFQYGWVSPVLAFVMSALGCLLGLLLANRARGATGRRRAGLLISAAIATGIPGVWLMHFIALLGFALPDSDIRYDPVRTVASLLVAVAMVWLGLVISNQQRAPAARLLLGGVVTGAGIAAMHFLGVSALRVGGSIGFDPARAAATGLMAVAAGTLLLSFSLVARTIPQTMPIAVLTAAALTGMHYLGMSSVEVRLFLGHAPITGVNPIFLLMPITVVGGTLIAVLAFLTFGPEPTAPPPAPDRPALATVPPRYPPTYLRK